MHIARCLYHRVLFMREREYRVHRVLFMREHEYRVHM
jgi:hypothetical protein